MVAALLALAALLLATPATGIDDDTLDQLRALGYVDYSEDAQPAARSGVVFRDAARSQPGYNLYASRPLQRAELIDAEGRVVRSWSGEGEGHWSRVRLLPNGDLLVVGVSGRRPEDGRLADQDRFLERRSFQGELLWRRSLPVHHDVNVAPGGRLMALYSDDRVVPELDPEAEIRDEGIVFVSPAGDVLGQRLFLGMLRARPDVFSLQPVRRRDLGSRLFMDLLHANAIEWMDDPALAARSPLYDLGNVLVTMRNQDTVAVLDWDAGEVVWAWGQGVLRGPHDAGVLPSGNLLIFDNRLGEGWSRVVEVDPLENRVVWEYRAPQPTDFYTQSRGSAQRLANGNTLIAESDKGHAFEVTPGGDVVWDFWNPHRDKKGRPATLIRMTRLDSARVEALLGRMGPKTPKGEGSP